jgi:hypothetical protein
MELAGPSWGGPKQRALLEKTESALGSNREREIASFSLNGCGQFLKTVQIEAVVPICDKSENVVICGTREEYPNLKSHVSISKTVLSGEARLNGQFAAIRYGDFDHIWGRTRDSGFA